MKLQRREVLKGIVALGAGAAGHKLLGSGDVEAVPQPGRPRVQSVYPQQIGDADYYVLDSSVDGDSVRVAMHFTVPAGSSFSGLTYSECLVQDTALNKQSVVPWVSAPRQSTLDAGLIFEHVIAFETNGDLAASVKRDRLDQRYNDLRPGIEEAIRRRYWSWGYERMMP